jgi:ribonuclease P protein component
MISAVGRLKRRPEFVRVAGTGRRWVTPGLIVQARRRADAAEATPGPPRVGFTASRRVGNAVARNRARRRLRALADKLLPELGVPGHDYVIVARAETVRRPFPALMQDLATALTRLRKSPERSRRSRSR